LGISFFDQTMVGWYALLAMIPAAIAIRPKRELTEAPVDVPAQAADLVSQFSEEPAGMGIEQYRT